MVLSDSPKHFICITKNGTNPAYEGARIGARRIAEQAGCRLTAMFPEKPDDIEQQRALLRESLAARPDALLVAPVHPTALDDELAAFKAAGTPVVSFVSRSQGVEPDCFVTSDNRALARAIARHLFAALGNKGRIAIIEGNPDSETSQPRTDGFHDALAGAPGIELVATGIGYYQRDPAARAMTEILDGQGDLDGVLVANDFMALGVIDVLRAAGSRAAVVSVNAMPEAIAALKSGDLLATSAFDAMKIACAATLAALRLVKGEAVPAYIELPVEIVTAENCAAWEKGYEERPLPSWEEAVAA